MFTISDKALNRLENYLREKSLTGMIRISAQKDESGSRLVMSLDAPKQEDDQYHFRKTTFLISKKLVREVGEIRIDFIDREDTQAYLISSAHPLPN